MPKVKSYAEEYTVAAEIDWLWKYIPASKTTAALLELPITFRNAPAESDQELDPLWECIRAKAFKVGCGTEPCTNRLKTAPFHAWLDRQTDELIIYYGFTAREPDRISRRQRILTKRGIRSDYPLLWSQRTIHDTVEVGIPLQHLPTWQLHWLP